MNDGIMSNDYTKASQAIKKAIDLDRDNPLKRKARVARNYYEYKHDILNHRIFYVDENGLLQEDKYASNVKIPHPFFTELVDQKVQYLLSNPVEVEVEDKEENEGLEEALKEYYTDDLQVVLQEAVEGASVKSHEYLYARTTSEDILTFDTADSLMMIPVEDEDNETVAFIRYYDRKIMKGTKEITITHAERWTSEDVTYFVSDDKGNFTLDESKVPNPRPHVLAIDEENDSVLGRTYGTIPFYRLSNNGRGTTDLEPIKALIDDYDLMNAFLSNNLHDFQEAIYVVKGFDGDDLSKIRQNIKAKKAVGTSEDGGLEIQTVNIPVEARKLKLEIDRENIYKFGMGFDSAQVGDGNITNVVIKSRYALLDLKCNKAEVRLKAMLSWMNRLIVDDINRRKGTSYKASDITVTITRETMVNENDIVLNEKTEAEAKATRIQAILAAAPHIGDETTLKLICEEFDLEFDEVKALVDEQDYTPNIAKGTDPGNDPLAGELNKAVTSVSKTLNGAQIASMLSVVEQVKNGIITADQGIAILTGSMGIDLAQAKKVIGVAEEVAINGPTN